MRPMTRIRYLLGILGPTVVTVVDHKPGLTAIDADVFAGDDNYFILEHGSYPVKNIVCVVTPEHYSALGA